MTSFHRNCMTTIEPQPGCANKVVENTFRRYVVFRAILDAQLESFRNYVAGLQSEPDLCTIVWGMDEAFQYMFVAGCVNAKLRQYIDEDSKLLGPKDAYGKPRKLCLRRSATRRTIMRMAPARDV